MARDPAPRSGLGRGRQTAQLVHGDARSCGGPGGLEQDEPRHRGRVRRRVHDRMALVELARHAIEGLVGQRLAVRLVPPAEHPDQTLPQLFVLLGRALPI